MFTTIIWATDGSSSADQALSYAQSIAAEYNARLVVAHCMETAAAHNGASGPLRTNAEELRAKVEKQASALAEEGFAVSENIFTGSAGARPAHAIAELAREIDANLIVAGTRGHTPLAGLMLGSVTQRLLHIAPCPLLAVPATPRAADPLRAVGPEAEAAQG